MLRPGPRRDIVGAGSKIKRFAGSLAGFRLSQFCIANHVFEIFEKSVNLFKNNKKKRQLLNLIFEKSREYGNFENGRSPPPT